MNIRGNGVLMLGTAVWFAQPALAQHRQQGGPLALLQNKSVQQELNLSAEQLAKARQLMQKVFGKYQPEFAKLGEIPSGERRDKVENIFKSIAAELEKEALAQGVFKPEQIKRFKEIELQQRGAPAFEDPAVQQRLKLTGVQKKKIQAIHVDAEKEYQALRDKGNFPGAAEQFDAVHKKAFAKALTLLTEEQRETWKELTGKPFELKSEQRRPDRGGRGA